MKEDKQLTVPKELRKIFFRIKAARQLAVLLLLFLEHIPEAFRLRSA